VAPCFTLDKLKVIFVEENKRLIGCSSQFMTCSFSHIRQWDLEEYS